MSSCEASSSTMAKSSFQVRRQDSLRQWAVVTPYRSLGARRNKERGGQFLVLRQDLLAILLADRLFCHTATYEQVLRNEGNGRLYSFHTGCTGHLEESSRLHLNYFGSVALRTNWQGATDVRVGYAGAIYEYSLSHLHADCRCDRR